MSDLADLFEIEDITPVETDTSAAWAKKALREIEIPAASGERIAKICSSTWYVRDDERVLDLADDLSGEQINAVGVVDAEGKACGIVTRQELFALLSRPYGREVMNRKPVSAVATRCRIFPARESIFAVSDAITKEMEAEELTHFALTTQDGGFGGIFSTRDMLVYLSDITRQDIELAQRIQRRIVQEYSRTDDAAFQLVASSTMAKGVGGDFYAVRNVRGNRWLFAVCDVSGKGVAASLITSVISGMINNYELEKGLKQFVTELNTLFVRTFQREKFVTGVFCELDAERGLLTMCDMAHSFAFLHRNGALSRLRSDAENMPIGISEDLVPELSKIHLRPGDVLMLLTDGVVEQTNMKGSPFSLASISRHLNEAESELESAFIRILESFHHFRGEAPLHDDVTFLMLRYDPY